MPKKAIATFAAKFVMPGRAVVAARTDDGAAGAVGPYGWSEILMFE
ncbi:hypothetical protein [Nonomuraea sp. B19D2]